jgi:hypothetical protein
VSLVNITDEEQLEKQQTANAIMKGGDLIGNDIILWTTIIEHKQEQIRDINVLISRSLSFWKATTGAVNNPAPGTDTPSAFKPRSGSKNAIYYILTKIISQTCNHIIFSSLKSWIS